MERKPVQLPMYMDPQRNMCIEMCTGACCSNLRFAEVSFETLNKLDPKNIRQQIVAVEEPTSDLELSEIWDEVRVQKTPFPPTQIFYRQNRNGTLTVVVSGDCVRKQADGRCEIYNERPQQCRNFAVGSVLCSDKREVSLLPPLPGAQTRDRRNWFMRWWKPLKDFREAG